MTKATHNFDANAISTQFNAVILDALLAVMVRTQNEIVMMLGKPGTGRLYATGRNMFSSGKARRSAASRAISEGRSLRAIGYHRASSPGDPPAADTGNLRRNVTVARPQIINEKDKIGWFLGIGVVYARALEYGYPKRRLLPRPYVMPSIEKVRQEAPAMLKKALESAGFGSQQR